MNSLEEASGDLLYVVTIFSSIFRNSSVVINQYTGTWRWRVSCHVRTSSLVPNRENWLSSFFDFLELYF